jgi:hypothetical protein
MLDAMFSLTNACFYQSMGIYVVVAVPVSAGASCIECGRSVSVDVVCEKIKAGIICKCARCK